MARRFGLLVVLPLLVLVPLALLAQQTPDPAPGEIRGVVHDSSGQPIPGARVRVEQNGSVVRSVTTDTRGAFVFTGLAPGAYDVRVSLPGFDTVTRPLSLTAGRGLREIFTLTVGALAETQSLAATSPAAPAITGAARGVGTGTIGGIVGGVASSQRSLSATAQYATGGRETYAAITPNGFRLVTNEPLSTFSADVDTASYANVRRILHEGRLPPRDAVRIEELINYFRADYSPPTGGPIGLTTEIGECPWAPAHKLVLLGLRTPSVTARGANTPGRNFVFLLDVSGSMQSPDKLPLVQSAMRMFVDSLRPDDRVAVVVYAGASGIALPSTRAADRAAIHSAIETLRAGGSTNGAAGIRLAYSLARDHYIDGGVNRVILATDGDFNVGVSSESELLRLIERERESGVFLSVLGVGTGNLQDSKMELLADKGNGNYNYLDTLLEARKVLISEAGATLQTVAKDVKIQVEFNPSEVAAYRLIGYENRLLANEDFNDDRKDAGDMGAGHTVTALYEVVPRGVPVPSTAGSGSPVDPLVYQTDRMETPRAGRGELLTFKVRYKDPDGRESRLLHTTARRQSGGAHLPFAAAVAQFGLLLRGDLTGSPEQWRSVAASVRAARGADEQGYRAELARLIELASDIPRPLTAAERR